MIEKLLISDQKLNNILIIENNENLVDLSRQNNIKLYTQGLRKESTLSSNRFLVRESIYERLKIANSLLPNSYSLCIFQGYRSLKEQNRIFQSLLNKLMIRYPEKTKEEVFIETTKLVSPVINFDGTINIPPHSTGGAVDLFLMDKEGNSLEMGLHPKDSSNDPTGQRAATDSCIISRHAQANRLILIECMQQSGFINYFTEYWHWSYGDRYWAYYTNSIYALYGSLDEKSLNSSDTEWNGMI